MYEKKKTFPQGFLIDENNIQSKIIYSIYIFNTQNENKA